MGRRKLVKRAAAWRREGGRLVRVVEAPEQCGLPACCDNDWAQVVFEEWTLSREAVAREAEDLMAVDLTSDVVDQSEIGEHRRLRGMLHFLGDGNRREYVRKLRVPFVTAQQFISSLLVLPNLEEMSLGGDRLSEVHACLLLCLPVLAPQIRRLSLHCIPDVAAAKAVAELQHLEELSGILAGRCLKTILQRSSSLRRVHLIGEQDRLRDESNGRWLEKIQSTGLKELRMKTGKVANVELHCPDLEVLQFDICDFSWVLQCEDLDAMLLVGIAANVIRGLKRRSPKIRLLEFCREETSTNMDFITPAKCIEKLHCYFPGQVSTRAVGEYEAYERSRDRVPFPCNEANPSFDDRDSAKVPAIRYQTILSISPKDFSFDSIYNLRLSEQWHDVVATQSPAFGGTRHSNSLYSARGSA
eukprot:gene31764-6962_t